VYNAVNMDVYHYAGNNPVKLVDPDGEMPQMVIGAFIGFGVATAVEIATHYTDTGNGTLANLWAASKAVANDSQSLKAIAVSTVIGAATAGLGTAVTTSTKAATTASQLAKIVAGNMAKNAIIGGTGSVINDVAIAKIKGQPITKDDVLTSFGQGAALAGVFSLAGDCVSSLGRTRFVDATSKAGGLRNPSIIFGEPKGIAGAAGTTAPYFGDIMKGVYDINETKQDKINKK